MALDSAASPPSLTPSLRHQRCERSRGSGHHRRGHGIVPGLVLIAGGGLALLREMGVLNPALRAW